MIKKYKSEVKIEDDHFVLPASMIVIRKKWLNDDYDMKKHPDWESNPDSRI